MCKLLTTIPLRLSDAMYTPSVLGQSTMIMAASLLALRLRHFKLSYRPAECAVLEVE